MPAKKPNDYPYPYIRGYGKYMGSTQGYINDTIKLAQRDNAPDDSWSYSFTEQRWYTFSELPDDLRFKGVLKEYTQRYG